MKEQSAKVIKAAHALSGDLNNLGEYYDKWAENYDDDVSKEQYEGTRYIANYFADLWTKAKKENNLNCEILDAGCGTGLVGVALKQKGYHLIDGCDISNEMTEKARETGAYRSLEAGVDVNNMSSIQENRYDAIISCGVFTPGHVPPTALEELVRITKTGGVIVLSTRKSYYESTDFQSVCDRLENQGKLKVISRVTGPYIAEEEAHYWGFEIC